MAWLRTMSRVAFIGNLAFLGCVLLPYVPALLATLGGIVGIWLNLAVNIVLLTLRLRRRPIPVPIWLIWVNAICCPIELFYFFCI